MRIAFIGQKGLDIGERGGGVEQHAAALASGLAERGNEVVVYARSRYRSAEPLARAGIRVRYLPTIYRKNLEAIVHAWLSTLDAMCRRYDIIHYHGVGPATLAWLPRWFKPQCKVIVTFHSQDRFHRKWGRLAKAYLHFGELAACWFPNATIAVSHVLQVYCRDHYRRQVIFIPNGAYVTHVPATDQLPQFGLEPGKYIVNVSRLIPHKGQHYLIEAWQMIQKQYPEKLKDIKLALVGAPSYTYDYERQLKDLAAGNRNIIFPGYQAGEALKQLFAHAYLYVHPSEAEGLPVVVLEAMSYGRPVLVSDIPENLEAMHHAGFSFKNKDSVDLSVKLLQLLNHPELVAEAARRVQDVVETEFNWSVIAEQTEAVYRSVRH
ncbi:glycosyltransferase family 4 protein [Patescibacteria group bacterium]|nr:glycosyltransferase family 4 protein [Patescibacteria group bacterium]MBU1705565.1 glycosyltransferase family 4 protein [Patescibacteria group bacterium]